MYLADGFDKALIGTSNNRTAMYSVAICLDILCSEHGMNMDEAIEYFEFNVSGAFIGENTPIWVSEMEPDEVIEALS